MSRWGSNATWLDKEAGILRQKERKSVNHVVLGVCDVALEVQCDVAQLGSWHFDGKREVKREPCRIGGVRCRVGSPTRRGSKYKLKAEAVAGHILRHY